MPLTFPAHQGLVLPVARKWPDYFDVLALSVGATMPDVIDSALGFPINGYFMQWYGHALIGVVTLDLPVGLLLTWLITVFTTRLLKCADLRQYLQILFTQVSPISESKVGRNNAHSSKTKLGLCSFSVIVGVLSHLGFDLISHDTNVLLYPWYDSVQFFPGWWYTTWFEFHSLPILGRSYSVGPFTLIWCILTLIGIFLFCRPLSLKYRIRNS